MYRLQECRRLLQGGDQILLDAQDLSHDDVRDVDVLCFAAAASSSSAEQPAPSGAAQPAAAPPSPESPPQGSAEHPLVREPGKDDEAVACASEAEDSPDNMDIAMLECVRRFAASRALLGGP